MGLYYALKKTDSIGEKGIIVGAVAQSTGIFFLALIFNDSRPFDVGFF